MNYFSIYSFVSQFQQLAQLHSHVYYCVAKPEKIFHMASAVPNNSKTNDPLKLPTYICRSPHCFKVFGKTGIVNVFFFKNHAIKWEIQQKRKLTSFSKSIASTRVQMQLIKENNYISLIKEGNKEFAHYNKRFTWISMLSHGSIHPIAWRNHLSTEPMWWCYYFPFKYQKLIGNSFLLFSSIRPIQNTIFFKIQKNNRY